MALIVALPPFVMAPSVLSADASLCLSSKSGAKGREACSSSAKDGLKKGSPANLNNFRDVIAYALDINPQIAYVRGQYLEARAGIGVAESSAGIQLDGSVGAGVGAQGTTSVPLDVSLLQNPAFTEAKRYIGSITAKKLLYDFGATDANISRAHVLAEAQRLTLESKVNDIGYSIADAYLRVF